jgi:hypothetical protein
MAEIVFGIDVLDLTDPAQPCCKCDACGQSTLFIKHQVRWFQLMFVPVIPLGKGFEVACLQCQSKFNLAQLSPEGLEYLATIKRSGAKRGGWMVGLTYALIAIFTTSIIIAISTSGQ